ncbi:hypothetical protein M8J75_005983 [Diaphorina citri]|nr:hypothetical protein M8J75_005983 [Diaphorina citri]
METHAKLPPPTPATQVSTYFIRNLLALSPPHPPSPPRVKKKPPDRHPSVSNHARTRRMMEHLLRKRATLKLPPVNKKAFPVRRNAARGPRVEQPWYSV